MTFGENNYRFSHGLTSTIRLLHMHQKMYGILVIVGRTATCFSDTGGFIGIVKAMRKLQYKKIRQYFR